MGVRSGGRCAGARRESDGSATCVPAGGNRLHSKWFANPIGLRPFRRGGCTAPPLPVILALAGAERVLPCRGGLGTGRLAVAANTGRGWCDGSTFGEVWLAGQQVGDGCFDFRGVHQLVVAQHVAQFDVVEPQVAGVCHPALDRLAFGSRAVHLADAGTRQRQFDFGCACAFAVLLFAVVWGWVVVGRCRCRCRKCLCSWTLRRQRLPRGRRDRRVRLGWLVFRPLLFPLCGGCRLVQFDVGAPLPGVRLTCDSGAIYACSCQRVTRGLRPNHLLEAGFRS